MVQCMYTCRTLHEDPFYIVDLGRVIHLGSMIYNILWMEKLPQLQPFYAVKCKEDPALVK